MNKDRRAFLKVIGVTATAGASFDRGAFAISGAPAPLIALDLHEEAVCRPLQTVELTIAGPFDSAPILVVLDGSGREYVRQQAKEKMEIAVGGALGRHTVRLLGMRGETIAETAFSVDCGTEVHDQGGRFQGLIEAILWTMMSWNQNNPVSAIRHNNRVYQFFANWIFDHTLILKGMKYYWPQVKDAIDFFAVTQREDGMIWENCYPAHPAPDYFDWKFHYGEFVQKVAGGYFQLRRAPVESHVEQYFVEGLYATWKATGDLEWMEGKLDAAMRALRQVQHSPYRWSEKHQLIHRGFTIDTWDYTSDDQQRFDGCVFTVFPGKSEFGVFHGDNTNLVAQSRHVAEMLRVAGRTHEALEFDELAARVEARLNALSWNGNFFTHWIAENPEYKPDVGVDMARQVSLSNAYALNRGIAHEKCVRILRTYQRIRKEMPDTSPGEFYGIYPPFEKNFTSNQPGLVWEYCNGGVLTVVGGELALGAFEHGFEEYGADILLRLRAIADRYRGYLPVTLRGRGIETPKRNFQAVNLQEAANATFSPVAVGLPTWSDDPARNLSGMPSGEQEVAGVHFTFPVARSHAGSCIIVARHAPFQSNATLKVAARGASVYLLNACSGSGASGLMVTFRYKDGSAESVDVAPHDWFMPSDTRYNTVGPRTMDDYRIAWKKTCEDEVELGAYATGIANPYPERTISELEFSANSARLRWLILAVSLCDAPVFFAPFDDLSTGIPDGWAGSVTQAVIEGLAGIKDEGAAFSKTALRPRWLIAQVSSAEITARYPASSGYCSYQYRLGESAIELDFTGSAEHFLLEVLLPQSRRPGTALLDGKVVETHLRTIEQSSYVVVPEVPPGVHHLAISLL
jgi:hypothetical protein